MKEEDRAAIMAEADRLSSQAMRAVPASGMNSVSPQNNASPMRYATQSAVWPGAAITCTSIPAGTT